MPITAALPDLPFLTALPVFWAKELKIILTPAIWGTFCLVLALLLREGPMVGLFTIFFYPLTCSAIGALAFGHDYTHKTIGYMLALPMSRRKIWWTRIALAAGLMMLASLIYVLVVDGRFLIPAIINGSAFRDRPSYIGLLYFVTYRILPAVLTGLCLAPWLTMISRSPMFGTVVSMGAPFALTQLLRVIVEFFGLHQSSTANTIYFWSMAVVFGLGGALGWRKFMTLEVIEGPVVSPTIAAKKSATSTEKFRRSSAAWQLIKKEIMLQRLPVGIAGLIIAFIVILPKDHAELLGIILPAIVLLVGSIASADERQMGTIQWQTLLPMPLRQQWFIKVAVAYAIAVIFGVAIPVIALLWKMDQLHDLTILPIPVAAAPILGGVLLLLATSLYISSLSQNGVRAMLVSLVVTAISLIAVGGAFNAAMNYLRDAAGISDVVQESFPLTILAPQTLAAFLVGAAGFVIMALYFAMQNHRAADNSRDRVFRQGAAFIAYEVAALAVIALTIRFRF
jgi:hypothetical protein